MYQAAFVTKFDTANLERGAGSFVTLTGTLTAALLQQKTHCHSLQGKAMKFIVDPRGAELHRPMALFASNRRNSSPRAKTFCKPAPNATSGAGSFGKSADVRAQRCERASALHKTINWHIPFVKMNDGDGLR